MKLSSSQIFVIAFVVFAFVSPVLGSPINNGPENLMDLPKYVSDSPGQTGKSQPVDRVIELNERFSEALIFGDVNIILTNDIQGKLQVTGDLSDLDHLKVNAKKGTLMINPGKRTRSRITLRLPVAGMSTLTIEGDSEISSSGTIIADALQIVLGGTSMVSVKYTGKLTVLAGAGAELIDISDYRKLVSR